MQRKKPFSAKARKAQLQQKRAIKRGDVLPPPSKQDRPKKSRRLVAHPFDQGPGPSSREAAAESTRRLQSSFVKLPQRFLENSKELASTLHLERPVPPEAVILRAETFASSEQDQTEVEKNEEGLFKKWLDQADDIVNGWCNPLEDSSSGDDEDESESPAPPSMPRAPTSFERNLETKHFQTLFWTPEVRLVDCPGLVMPNLVPMETQVLGGILPISRVSAIPLCIYHAAQLLPLETVFNLTHPTLSEPQVEDKRTWRVPRPDATAASGWDARLKKLKWTAMDVLTAYALKKGWVTAKAGRPDVMRAGNAILRSLAEGKISWGFWPEGTPQAVLDSHIKPEQGIWIPNENDASTLSHDEAEATDYEDEDEEEEDTESSEESEGTALDEEEEEAPKVIVAKSRFAALSFLDQHDDDSDEDASESE
ncbi:hypothetical protein EUX98_g730 [Antrodiella citrinella]|uniref:Uncharacterized protein n=1 Tax=Antrodiella citrinella TaxID=2447956 RepID=A0A4S4NBS6_9APHY|nr:hypothetical protein EUX98_g730 [Antrodiella citrinella]